MSLDLPTVFPWFSELYPLKYTALSTFEPVQSPSSQVLPSEIMQNASFPMVFPSCPMVVPWFSPVVPWLSHGFPQFSQGFSPVFHKASRCLSTKTGSWSSSRAPRGSKVAQRLWNLGSHRIRTGYRGYIIYTNIYIYIYILW